MTSITITAKSVPIIKVIGLEKEDRSDPDVLAILVVKFEGNSNM